MKRRRRQHLTDPDALYAAIAARFPRRVVAAARPVPGLMASRLPTRVSSARCHRR
ncbi:MAG: hypothetical protein V9G19_04130 [Tetrasphaera sp.]